MKTKMHRAAGQPEHASPLSSASFVDPTAYLSGSVKLASQDYVGPFVLVEAQQPFSVELASQVNLQDNVTVSATTRNTIIGFMSSIAHGAHVRDSAIGDFAFVGFNAVVEDSVIQDGAMVLHGARVRNVTIPKNRVVPPGALITDASQVADLQPVAEADMLFKEEVISVNVELAEGYSHLAAEKGPASVRGISYNPQTSWNSQPVSPGLDEGVRVAQQARVIGNVRVGKGSTINEGVSLRGDEGSPIWIGPGARIGSHVTFHSLKEQMIRIGSDFAAGSQAVLHGPLNAGDGVIVSNQAVVFKSSIGNHVHIGRGAIVIGVRLADGTRIPDGFHVLDQVTANRFNESALEQPATWG